MNDKNLYFISTLSFIAVFTMIFYLIGKHLIKNNRKLLIIATIIIGITQLLVINFVWFYNINLSPIQKGIISGLSGCMIGITAGGISNKS